MSPQRETLAYFHLNIMVNGIKAALQGRGVVNSGVLQMCIQINNIANGIIATYVAAQKVR